MRSSKLTGWRKGFSSQPIAVAALLMSAFLTLYHVQPASAQSINSCLTSGAPGSTNDLIIETGETLTMSGEWFCDEVTVRGTLNIAQYNGTDPATGNLGTGRLVLHANSIDVQAGGVIDGSAAGFAGGAGGNGGSGGMGGNGGTGNLSNPTGGQAGTGGLSGSAGSSGSGAGAGSGGAAGNNSTNGGGAGAGSAFGGNGGSGGQVNTGGSAGNASTYGISADASTDETLLLGAGGGGGAGGAGGKGGGGGGGGGAAGANGGAGGSGGSGGVGGTGGRGGGLVKLYAQDSLTINGSIVTKGQAGNAGSQGSSGADGVNGTGLGAGSKGAGGASNSAGTHGQAATLSTGGAGGGGGAGGATGKSGGAGSGGGILLRSEQSDGITITGTLDARSGNNGTGVNAGTIKVFYACGTPSVGTNNGRVFSQILEPTFNNINPASGPSNGGQVVNITGARLCTNPTVSLGGALDPTSAPTATNTNPGTVLPNTKWVLGDTVRYLYTARVGDNETAASPISNVAAQPTVLDPTSPLTVTNASQGVKAQGSAYTVGDTVQYQYAAENNKGKTNVSPNSSLVATNAVSNVNATNGGLGILDATNGWAPSTTYYMWVTLRTYPTQTDFNDDTNGTETLAGSSTSVTTESIATKDNKLDITLPNFSCTSPGANGCLWNQGRIRIWYSTTNSFNGASLANKPALGTGTLSPYCSDSTGKGFKMGESCGDSGTWPSTFNGSTFTVHLRAGTTTPSPARPANNSTGTRQIDVSVPAPPSGLIASPSTKNGLLYRKVNAGTSALLDTNTSYTGSYTVSDLGNVASSAPPTANTTGVQTMSVSWNAVSNATGYNIYRCIGSCSSITDEYDLIASYETATTSLVDTGLETNADDGPPSTNETLCQSPSVNSAGTSLTCTTVSHPSGTVDLQLFNNVPSAQVNSLAATNVYSYSPETSQPSQPGTPTASNTASVKRPTWIWTASTDNPGIDHYVFEWCTNSTFANCGAGSGSATVGATVFTHTSDLTDGTWYARVKAIGTSGNESVFSGNGSVVIQVVDAINPTITNNCGSLSAASPCQQTTYFNATPGAIYDLDVSDVGESHLATLQVRTCSAPDGDGTCSAYTDIVTNLNSTDSFTTNWALPQSVFNAMVEGDNYVSVRVFDGAANSATLVDAFRVRKDTVQPSAPSNLLIASPANNSTPSLSWGAVTDATSGIEHYRIQWSQDNSFTSTVVTATTSTVSCILSAINNCSGSSSGLADGTWYARVGAVDHAGNSSPYSTHVSVAIDTAAPPSEPELREELVSSSEVESTSTRNVPEQIAQPVQRDPISSPQADKALENTNNTPPTPSIFALVQSNTGAISFGLSLTILVAFLLRRVFN